MTQALVIGAGPAGLMAAEVLAQAGVSVLVCEAKPSVGRKFLMAGKSGLNVTKDAPRDAFLNAYSEGKASLTASVSGFDADAVKAWATGLGQEIFTGSSGRVFPKAMKASPLLRAWLARLDALGVERRTRWRWTGWDGADAVFDTPDGEQRIAADVTVLALGGASWARLGSDGLWSRLLVQEGVGVAPFVPSNAGLAVPWTDHMAPYVGQPIKAVRWTAGGITSRGEATLSARGLEGGGIYSLSPALRDGASLSVDLVPDQSVEVLATKLSAKRGKLRLAHWLKNALRLPPIKIALFFEGIKGAGLAQDAWPQAVKSVPISHEGFLPIDEAISTAGGVKFDALTEGLMLKARPGVFCAGEMLNWDAPTGGYLITACLATGRKAGKSALDYLAAAA